MGHQIGLHEAGRGLIPIVKGAYRDLLFEQRSRAGGRDAMPLLLAIRLENPIGGSLPHREELPATLLAQLQMPMSFQRVNQGRQKGNEPLGTDVVGRRPRQM
jgi:hypothetical protein